MCHIWWRLSPATFISNCGLNIWVDMTTNITLQCVAFILKLQRSAKLMSHCQLKVTFFGDNVLYSEAFRYARASRPILCPPKLPLFVLHSSTVWLSWSAYTTGLGFLNHKNLDINGSLVLIAHSQCPKIRFSFSDLTASPTAILVFLSLATKQFWSMQVLGDAGKGTGTDPSFGHEFHTLTRLGYWKCQRRLLW